MQSELTAVSEVLVYVAYFCLLIGIFTCVHSLHYFCSFPFSSFLHHAVRRSRFDANWLNYQQHSMLSDGLLDVPNVRFAFAR